MNRSEKLRVDELWCMWNRQDTQSTAASHGLLAAIYALKGCSLKAFHHARAAHFYAVKELGTETK